MELKERLYMGKVLIDILNEQCASFDIFDDEWPDLVKRTLMVKLRMTAFYRKHGEPPEMQEQIDRIDDILNRMYEAQAKGGKKR